MTDAMDHDRCSELLPAFLDGEVPQDVAGAIEVHLASCHECATERRGLEALRGNSSERLTAAERAALQRGVMSGISQ
ncbi:MAG: zf-HC2 domain-containing protein, partial [Actinobacteria bacterium]|nr:zf-HC2 domain-containing protein [Actinomycetota bacterium]